MSNMPIALMEDSPPYLDFQLGVKELRNESIKAGRKIDEDVEIVYITPMGDNKTQNEDYVPDWLSHLKDRLHHNQISQKYYDFCFESYQAWKHKRAAPVTGMPIEQWPQVTKAQVRMITDANIRTVEDLAKAPDEALGAIGMGARELKRKAEVYLKSAADHGAVSEKVNDLEIQVKSANDEKDEMLQRIADLEAKLSEKPVIKPKKGKAA